MWLHLILYAATVVLLLFRRKRRMALPGEPDRETVRLFVLLVLVCNTLGLVLTMKNGKVLEIPEGGKIEKETGRSGEQTFLVTVDGKKKKVSFWIPGKEQKDPEDQEESENRQDEALLPDNADEEVQSIREVVQEYNLKADDPEYFYLPDEADGKRLVWNRPGDSSGSFIAAIGIVAGFAVIILKTRERQNKEIRRQELFLRDYPELVMKFTLLLQAGMTPRGAFYRISERAGSQRNDPRHPLAGEIVTLCHELDTGVSESEAYRRFGERCAQVRYKTFSTLLIQNLQKGSRQMIEMLERESEEAFDERKRKARMMGETALTKLLGPMIMMLGVVLVLILVPAFLRFL